MRPNPHNILVIAGGMPGTVAATHQVYHRQFPEVRGTGRSRRESVNDLLDRLDRAACEVDEGWPGSLIKAARQAALTSLAEERDPRLAPSGAWSWAIRSRW